MKLHEYQSKQIFARYGIPIPDGEVATTPAEARAIAERLGKTVVIKSQVLVGGRGKAGGIKLAKTPAEAEEVAGKILGMDIKGLIVNKVLESVSFEELLSQLDIEPGADGLPLRVHFGGPVESGRGFVLHSADYMQDSSIVVDDKTALTATVDILRDLASGSGPKSTLLAIGYAGWGPGQLESEIHANAWLNAPVSEALLFDDDDKTKWDRALKSLGVDVSLLSATAGRA